MIVLTEFASVGLLLFVSGAKCLAHWQMQRSIHRKHVGDEDLLTLVFPLENGKLVDGSIHLSTGNEFKYKGTMYDIVSKKIIGNQLFVQCVNDRNETFLSEIWLSLSHKFAAKEGSSNKTASVILQYLAQPYVQLQQSIKMDISNMQVTALLHPPYFFGLSQPHGDIHTPPPKFYQA